MDFVRRGERHNQAKLTEADVREIRRLRADGMKLASISRRFMVSTGTVSDIVNRKTWRHVDAPDHSPGAADKFPGVTCTTPRHCRVTGAEL